jgi:hypothetical protein
MLFFYLLQNARLLAATAAAFAAGRHLQMR